MKKSKTSEVARVTALLPAEAVAALDEHAAAKGPVKPHFSSPSSLGVDDRKPAAVTDSLSVRTEESSAPSFVSPIPPPVRNPYASSAKKPRVITAAEVIAASNESIRKRDEKELADYHARYLSPRQMSMMKSMHASLPSPSLTPEQRIRALTNKSVALGKRLSASSKEKKKLETEKVELQSSLEHEVFVREEERATFKTQVEELEVENSRLRADVAFYQQRFYDGN